MEGLPIIRPAQLKDREHIVRLARIVAADDDAFAWEGDRVDGWDENAIAADLWLPDPGQHRETFVCEMDRFEGIVGAYVMQPSGMGRWNHIAQGSYMVDPGVRRCGLGKQLCAHSVREAKRRRYTGMQLSMVPDTNIAALKALSSCGFKIMCTLPRAFRHSQAGLVDAHMMYHDFSGMEVASHNHRSCLKTSEAVASYNRRSCFKPTEAVQYADPKSRLVLAVGEEVHLHPQPTSSFSVHPALPKGLSLCSSTGAIRGSPLESCPEMTYRISAAEVTFQVVAESPRRSEASNAINEAFAAQLEKIDDPAQLGNIEPARTRAYGDWMIWMVHRAWLNDPTLVDFNFNNMHMPPPHVEPRIAPKLMAAMKTNTHIKVLSLSNANVQKSQGLELAEALCENCTVSTINLESNCLDSNSVREIALQIRNNSGSCIEHLRFSHQRQMGNLFFGRPAEEAVGMMMQRNMSIVKLGFECDDAHWRNEIDRALVRNNDRMRRELQNAGADNEESDAPDAEKTLGQVTLQALPPVEVFLNEFFVEGSDHHSLLRAYMAQNLQLPTWPQLKHYAKNVGADIPYTAAAPLIRDCRAWLLDAAIAKEVSIVDAFGMVTEGVFTAWNEFNATWSVDICTPMGTRVNFKSDKEPVLFLSTVWGPWLHRGTRSRGGA